MESELLLSLIESTSPQRMEGSMMTTPTPEEAQRALHDIADAKQQTVDAAASSRRWYIGWGIVAAAIGVVADLAPGFSGTWGQLIIALLLVFMLVRQSRWGASLFGRRLSPRLPGSLAARLGVGVIAAIVILALTVGAMWLHIPHLSSWVGIGGGLLIALAGPWWQRRVLRRGAQL
jgi:hypothetical protein